MNLGTLLADDSLDRGESPWKAVVHISSTGGQRGGPLLILSTWPNSKRDHQSDLQILDSPIFTHSQYLCFLVSYVSSLADFQV